MYIAPGQGQKIPWGQTFYVNRKPLSLWPFVESFKQISLNSNFRHSFFFFLFFFFMFFHIYIAPGQGQTTLCGHNPDVNRKHWHFARLLQVSKKYLWSLILYIIFHVFMHVYSPGAGPDNPLVTKFWRQQKAQMILTICCKFQNDLFEFWFYTHFLIILYMYIAPGQGQTKP